MVMEAPPSPQSVGREFVRQYYTLLNKAPTHLHRFYNHQSSFVHGGLDPPNRETSPVIGQKQIHQKIQQLNFRDCHAKITQVDSQATLGNGVVVQVTGELSNAGQPMRRFTQTFVLAAQSPKKYYVHNDIFRYQDEIISDEECDDGVHSEPEEDVTPERQVLSEVQQPINQPAIPQYYNPNAAPIQPNIPQVPVHHNQQPPPHVLNPQPVPTVNGAIHPEDISVLPGQVPTHVPVPSAQTQGLGAPIPNLQQGLVQAPLNVPTPIEEQQPQLIEEPVEEPLETNYSEPQEPELEQQEVSIELASSEPKTYANLLKSGSTVPFSSPPQVASMPAAQPIRSVSPPPANMNPALGARSNNNINNRGGVRVNQQQPRMPIRQDSGRGAPGRNSINDEGVFDDRRRSQSMNFNDLNQLFLGNLPHTATEDELREIFSDFGAILDLRVHSKPTNKVGGPPGARAPPNYGFITYETQQGVQNCLQAKPIFYPKDDKNGTLLNVEEKKTKDRPSYGGGRPSTENNRGRGDNSGQRRGMGGPGGPNRSITGGPGGTGGPNNRNNNYNRSNGPPNRGPNTYNRR
ncbi:hypothetical protein NQ314_007864 [Rhamnusium bicolor]|uniref:Ras GTPase-activating protein-binding protein 2 n=1 Tax=Rhamnusium bicolor TaxID=1586634 RepID=A0AAV8YI58_9CUCU|nr:hypothetical protein NQ314_007864 [Rhamnusium bicolor]